MIRILQRDNDITWFDFCYDLDRLNVLTERLRRARTNSLSRSVAVAFRVVKITDRKDGTVRVESERVRYPNGPSACIHIFASEKVAADVSIGAEYAEVGRVFIGDFKI